MNVAIVTWILFLVKIEVSAYDLRMPLYNRRPLSIANRLPVTNLALQHYVTILQKQCYLKNVLKKCPIYPMTSTSNTMTNIDRNFESISRDQPQEMSISGNERTAQISLNMDNSPLRRMKDQKFNSNIIPFSLHGKLDGYLSQHERSSGSTMSSKLNLKLDRVPPKSNEVVQIGNLTTESASILSSTNSSKENINNVEFTTAAIDVQSSTVQNTSPDIPVYKKFSQSLDSFERKFYAVSDIHKEFNLKNPRLENAS